MSKVDGNQNGGGVSTSFYNIQENIQNDINNRQSGGGCFSLFPNWFEKDCDKEKKKIEDTDPCDTNVLPGEGIIKLEFPETCPPDDPPDEKVTSGAESDTPQDAGSDTPQDAESGAESDKESDKESRKLQARNKRKNGGGMHKSRSKTKSKSKSKFTRKRR